MKVQSKKIRIAISFDDGYHDNLVAADLLEKFHLPATFFLSTYYIENQMQYYWDVLSMLESKRIFTSNTNELQPLSSLLSLDDKKGNARELTKLISVLPRQDRINAITELTNISNTILSSEEKLKLGIPMKIIDAIELARSEFLRIAAHTETHPSLGEKLDEEDLSTEIQVSIKKIMEWSNKASADFALPFGTKLDYSEKIRAITERSRIERIWSTEARTVQKSDTNVLPRLVVGNWKTGELLHQIARTMVRSQIK
jgi:peptidoglycan/xylan/chitin deacetylase (PgdA/CDA1 family)